MKTFEGSQHKAKEERAGMARARTTRSSSYGEGQKPSTSLPNWKDPTKENLKPMEKKKKKVSKVKGKPKPSAGSHTPADAITQPKENNQKEEAVTAQGQASSAVFAEEAAVAPIVDAAGVPHGKQENGENCSKGAKTEEGPVDEAAGVQDCEKPTQEKQEMDEKCPTDQNQTAEGAETNCGVDVDASAKLKDSLPVPEESAESAVSVPKSQEKGEKCTSEEPKVAKQPPGKEKVALPNEEADLASVFSELTGFDEKTKARDDLEKFLRLSYHDMNEGIKRSPALRERAKKRLVELWKGASSKVRTQCLIEEKSDTRMGLVVRAQYTKIIPGGKDSETLNQSHDSDDDDDDDEDDSSEEEENEGQVKSGVSSIEESENSKPSNDEIVSNGELKKGSVQEQVVASPAENEVKSLGDAKVSDTPAVVAEVAETSKAAAAADVSDSHLEQKPPAKEKKSEEPSTSKFESEPPRFYVVEQAVADFAMEKKFNRHDTRHLKGIVESVWFSLTAYEKCLLASENYLPFFDAILEHEEDLFANSGHHTEARDASKDGKFVFEIVVRKLSPDYVSADSPIEASEDSPNEASEDDIAKIVKQLYGDVYNNPQARTRFLNVLVTEYLGKQEGGLMAVRDLLLKRHPDHFNHHQATPLAAQEDSQEGSCSIKKAARNQSRKKSSVSKPVKNAPKITHKNPKAVTQPKEKRKRGKKAQASRASHDQNLEETCTSPVPDVAQFVDQDLMDADLLNSDPDMDFPPLGPDHGLDCEEGDVSMAKVPEDETEENEEDVVEIPSQSEDDHETEEEEKVVKKTKKDKDFLDDSHKNDPAMSKIKDGVEFVCLIKVAQFAQVPAPALNISWDKAKKMLLEKCKKNPELLQCLVNPEGKKWPHKNDPSMILGKKKKKGTLGLTPTLFLLMLQELSEDHTPSISPSETVDLVNNKKTKDSRVFIVQGVLSSGQGSQRMKKNQSAEGKKERVKYVRPQKHASDSFDKDYKSCVVFVKTPDSQKSFMFCPWNCQRFGHLETVNGSWMAIHPTNGKLGKTSCFKKIDLVFEVIFKRNDTTEESSSEEDGEEQSEEESEEQSEVEFEEEKKIKKKRKMPEEIEHKKKRRKKDAEAARAHSDDQSSERLSSSEEVEVKKKKKKKRKELARVARAASHQSPSPKKKKLSIKKDPQPQKSGAKVTKQPKNTSKKKGRSPSTTAPTGSTAPDFSGTHVPDHVLRDLGLFTPKRVGVPPTEKNKKIKKVPI